MKLNIAYPANGTQKCFDVTTKDEQRFYGKKIGDQFEGTIISEEFVGSVLQIVGGNDYQGFCMVPNKDTVKRLRLLLKKGDVGYRCREKGVRKKKTVRGSKVSSDIQCLSLILLKENLPIVGLTDKTIDKSHLPRRLPKLLKLFNVKEGDNIRAVLKMRGAEKIPKIRISGQITEEEIKRRSDSKALRISRKEKYLKEKKEYELTYGEIIKSE